MLRELSLQFYSFAGYEPAFAAANRLPTSSAHSRTPILTVGCALPSARSYPRPGAKDCARMLRAKTTISAALE
jgi:hypothetical protein